MHFLLILLSEK